MIKNVLQKFSIDEKSILRNPHVLGCAALMIALSLPTQGFCADAADAAMNTMAENVTKTIFAPWVRKTALALGGGLGIFQSIGAGSFKPFMIWGGIGLLINFIPKLVEYLSTVGI